MDAAVTASQGRWYVVSAGSSVRPGSDSLGIGHDPNVRPCPARAGVRGPVDDRLRRRAHRSWVHRGVAEAHGALCDPDRRSRCHRHRNGRRPFGHTRRSVPSLRCTVALGSCSSTRTSTCTTPTTTCPTRTARCFDGQSGGRPRPCPRDPGGDAGVVVLREGRRHPLRPRSRDDPVDRAGTSWVPKSSRHEHVGESAAGPRS